MFIQIHETPNPNTLKFLPGITIMPEGQSASFRSESDCETSALAKKLLIIIGVESIFFGHDFISITKSEDADWMPLKAMIVAPIVDHITAGLPIIQCDLKHKDVSSNLSLDDQEIIKQICEVIDEKVRPSVAQDGGDIQFHSYSNGVVYLTMHGACSGCPSATVTLKDGIENMLQYYVPEVIRVESI